MLDIRLELKINKDIDKLLKAEQKKFKRKNKQDVKIAALVRRAIVKTYRRGGKQCVEI